jgi:hypothetical protein
VLLAGLVTLTTRSADLIEALQRGLAWLRFVVAHLRGDGGQHRNEPQGQRDGEADLGGVDPDKPQPGATAGSPGFWWRPASPRSCCSPAS